MILCGELVVHGAAPHRLALELFPYKGTLMPSEGMENVCATPLPALELITRNGLALRVATLPVSYTHLTLPTILRV